jgi:voltage-gated sodium channel
MTLTPRLKTVVESPLFLKIITALIIINAVTLGLETSDMIMARYGNFLHVFDRIILSAFVIEIISRLFVYRLSFFRNGWNVFDFLVIGISLIPAIGPFAMLRTLRVLRVLRLMSAVPRMRRVITALFSAIPGMGSIMAVLLLIFYVAAVITTQVFGKSGDPALEDIFGTIGHSMFTLFQLMTLEGWADNIALPTMKLFPWSWVFFVTFIMVTTFAVLNLFIGIIVDAMNILHEQDDTDGLQHAHQEQMSALKDLRAEIAGLKATLERVQKND